MAVRIKGSYISPRQIVGHMHIAYQVVSDVLFVTVRAEKSSLWETFSARTGGFSMSRPSPNRSQTEILILEPTAWKREPLPEDPVALLPRSCMSVAKALWALVMLPDCRAVPIAARSVLKVVL